MIRIKTEVLKPIISVLSNIANEEALQIGNDGIYFEMYDGGLDISAENREMNILFSDIESDEEDTYVEDMRFLVNADKLNHVISTATSEYITFKTQGESPEGGHGKVKIKTNGMATLPLYDCSVFNKLDFKKDSDVFSTWKFSKNQLTEYLEKLEMFVIRGASNFNLSGICIEKTDSGIVWMGRNNHRGIMFYSPFNVEGQIVFSSNTAKVLKSMKIENFVARVEDKNIIFNAEESEEMLYNLQITSKLLDVDYPLQRTKSSLETIIKKASVEIVVDTVKMRELLSQLKGFLDDAKRVNAILTSKGELKLSAGDSMSGKMKNKMQIVSIENDIEEIRFAFNHEFMEMFLKVVATKEFSVSIPTEGNNIMISSGNKFRHDKESEWTFFMTTYTLGN